MQDKRFIAGKFRRQLVGKITEYQSFSPSFINKTFTWQDPKITIILEEAMQLLGKLNAHSALIPDVEFFIQMHVTKEASTSSKIEGTKTNIDEALMRREEIDPEKRNDWEEVQNYIRALNFAIRELEQLPLCFRLIKNTHAVLLSGVRGEGKHPGEIRKSQNWIGGSSLQDAFFIPPHSDELGDLLADLEKFWHNPSLNIPHLIKIALTHYQFETIHPFLDGNGRIGRLLIILQLIDYQILTKPCLYLSHFFEQNRISYYDSLSIARQNSDIEQWIKFFLTGITEAAKDSLNTFSQIIDLRKRYEEEIKDLGRRVSLAQNILLEFFQKPICDISYLKEQLNITYNTVNSIVNVFVEKNILEEITGHTRNRLFVLKEYLDLFRK